MKPLLFYSAENTEYYYTDAPVCSSCGDKFQGVIRSSGIFIWDISGRIIKPRLYCLRCQEEAQKQTEHFREFISVVFRDPAELPEDSVLVLPRRPETQYRGAGKGEIESVFGSSHAISKTGEIIIDNAIKCRDRDFMRLPGQHITQEEIDRSTRDEIALMDKPLNERQAIAFLDDIYKAEPVEGGRFSLEDKEEKRGLIKYDRNRK